MLERVIWFVVSLVVLVLAFFFLAVALVVGAVLAVVLLARIWWIRRRMSKAQQDQIITTEYTVVERDSVSQERLPDAIEGQAREVTEERADPVPGSRRREG